MAKAQLKKKEEVVKEEGFKAIDLTAEKRIELFVQAYQKFEKESAETFGVKLGVEQNYLPQAIVPKLVVIDLLKKNENKPTENPKA
jgi:hypothetical protein